LFSALIFAVASRHAISMIGPFVGVALGAGGSIALAAWLERPIPALVGIGALVVLFTPAFRTIRRVDRRTTVVAVAVAISVAAALALRTALA
jgi:hypothetical protein